MKQKLALIALMTFSQSAWSYGTGWLNSPLESNKRLVSTEVTGITSSGGGIGVQARFTQKLTSKLAIDAGLGFAGGAYSGRVFAGVDYEVLPDYMNQPRFAVKFSFENTKVSSRAQNVFGVAPTFSKGLSFWGDEAYPFISLPMTVNLDKGSSTYTSTISANIGVTGKLPIDGFRNVTGTVEAMIKVKDTYSGILVGLAFPIN